MGAVVGQGVVSVLTQKIQTATFGTSFLCLTRSDAVNFLEVVDVLIVVGRSWYLSQSPISLAVSLSRRFLFKPGSFLASFGISQARATCSRGYHRYGCESANSFGCMEFHTSAKTGLTLIKVPVKSETGFWTSYWLSSTATFEDLKRAHVKATADYRFRSVGAPNYIRYGTGDLFCELPGWGRVTSDRPLLPALLNSNSKWVNIFVVVRLPHNVEGHKKLNKFYRRSSF